MKALFLFVLMSPFLKVSTTVEEKKIIQQYYKFESACHILYTTDKSTILTFYTDSSFVLETYLIKRGGESIYTKREAGGKLNFSRDAIYLIYFTQEVNSVSGNGRLLFSSDPILLHQLPTHCVRSGDFLITNSTLINELSLSKNKAFALSGKQAYELALKNAGKAAKHSLF